MTTPSDFTVTVGPSGSLILKGLSTTACTEEYMRKESQNMVVGVLVEGAWCNIDLLDAIGGCASRHIVRLNAALWKQHQGSLIGFLHTLCLHIDRP